jgi:hypothetical protein
VLLNLHNDHNWSRVFMYPPFSRQQTVSQFEDCETSAKFMRNLSPSMHHSVRPQTARNMHASCCDLLRVAVRSLLRGPVPCKY